MLSAPPGAAIGIRTRKTRGILGVMSADVLTIHGERRHRAESHEHEGFRTEFRYGAFTRSITLPQSVDADAIRASYHDGILEVVVPMPAAAEPKATQIPVAHD